MSHLWFPDNSVLCNFAAVQSIGLLKSDLQARGRWSAAVAYETENSSAFLPNLRELIDGDWLSDPIETTEGEAEVIDRIRVAAFGGNDQKPLQHLGEAETCHILRTRPEFAGSVWITDDIAALDFGRRGGLTTWSTRTIVEHLIANGELSEDGGFALLRAMEAADRFVFNMPTAVRDLH
ncbi:hypothetical protein [Antribacter gilvus]|uniref:hypothetical protein n=1 Tax=Antribacter gilvus TaxID=2304675 RepID=UPI000F77989D|nr:hypothetical protein [Antribacter gilvus]